MKLIKKAFVAALVLVFILSVSLFSGCAEESMATGTPFSQTLTPEEGVRIWYECQNKIKEKEEEETDLTNLFAEDEDDSQSGPTVYGRETRVIWIKVYKGGKVTSYSCSENVYLGHFAKMTDEEILKELDANPDTYFVGQKDEAYEVYLYTDAAGQEVVFEGIPAKIKMAKDDDPMYFMTLISKEQIKAFQVYDSYYGGYELYNYDETLFGEAVMVTRCDQSEVFGLDDMALENAILDYMTPEEMLHEKNAELKDALKKEKNS